MRTSWWFLGWAVVLASPGLVQAQHGGHSAGHVGGIAPAHFYGGSGGMHAPPPLHVAPLPPVHMPVSPAMHLPAAPPMHLPNPSLPVAPHVPTTATIHAPGGHVPGSGSTTSGSHATGSHATGIGLPGTGIHTPSLNPTAQLEAARLAALEARYLGSPWLYGYPGYYGQYGLSGVPYYNAANHLYGYGYGYGFGVYQRPYYYGYLNGVPYINSNNYSPVYYSLYNELPSTTGTVTTQNALSAAGGLSTDQSTDESPSLAPQSDVGSINNITPDQAREALTRAEQDLAAGRYQQAVQNAGKAAMQLHEESEVHEVLWLALMGLADYRGAAIEAHAMDHFGVTPNWNDIAMKHDDPTRFNAQMKKLESFVQRNKDSDFAAFLLGYNYLVLDHKDAARQWLEEALKMDPQDALCSKLVASLKEDTSAAKPVVGLLPNDDAQSN